MELAAHDPIYEEMVGKFLEHFVYIAAGMNRPGHDGMWDDEDGFYYDLLRLPDGSSTRLKVRSMVGLLPLCSTTVIEKWQRERVPTATSMFQARMRQMPELMESVHPSGPGHLGVNERGLIALVNPDRLRRILTKVLDENEFLSPYGIRSLSKFHEQHPYIFHAGGKVPCIDGSDVQTACAHLPFVSDGRLARAIMRYVQRRGLSEESRQELSKVLCYLESSVATLSIVCRCRRRRCVLGASGQH